MLLSLLLYHHFPGKALAYARLAFPLPPRLPLTREVAGAARRRERCSRTAVQPPHSSSTAPYQRLRFFAPGCPPLATLASALIYAPTPSYGFISIPNSPSL